MINVNNSVATVYHIHHLPINKSYYHLFFYVECFMSRTIKKHRASADELAQFFKNNNLPLSKEQEQVAERALEHLLFQFVPISPKQLVLF